MKNYLITFATIFFGALAGFHIVIIAFLFGMWDLGKLPEMYESDGFWALTRILFLFSLVIPIIQKFKIVKIK